MIFKRSSKWKPKLKHGTEWMDQHDTYCAVTSHWTNLEITYAVFEVLAL